MTIGHHLYFLQLPVLLGNYHNRPNDRPTNRPIDMSGKGSYTSHKTFFSSFLLLGINIIEKGEEDLNMRSILQAWRNA